MAIGEEALKGSRMFREVEHSKITLDLCISFYFCMLVESEYMCVHVHTHTYKEVGSHVEVMWRPEDNLSWRPARPSISLGDHLSFVMSLSISIVWVAYEYQDSVYHYLPDAEVMVPAITPGVKLRSL